MKHLLSISFSKKPKTDGIVSCRSIAVRERLLRLFLGSKARLMIILPGDTVKELAIRELGSGEGGAHEAL